MKVAIIGQKWMGERVLRLCQDRGDRIVGACAPLSPDGREDRLRAAARAAGIPMAGNVGRQYLLCEITAGPLDLILCAHAHVFVPEYIRRRARHGAIGYHPSLLPRHRGRDAVRWAIAMRDGVTGGSVYLLDDGADTGPVLAQDWCFIRPDDNAESLWRRDLAPMGLRLLSDVLERMDPGYVQGVPQDETLATWEPGFPKGSLAG